MGVGSMVLSFVARLGDFLNRVGQISDAIPRSRAARLCGEGVGEEP